MSGTKSDDWYTAGLSDGKHDHRNVKYRTALMFADAYLAFVWINVLHNALYFAAYYFLWVNADVPSAVLLLCAAALVPLLLEVRAVLRLVDGVAGLVPLLVLVLHALSAIPDARARNVTSILAAALTIVHVVARLSKPPNDPLCQRTYGSFALGLIGHASIRVATLSVAPALFTAGVVPICVVGLLPAFLLFREGRNQKNGAEMVPLAPIGVCSPQTFFFFPIGVILAFWLITVFAFVAWPGTLTRYAGVNPYPQCLLILFSLIAGAMTPFLLRWRSWARHVMRAREASVYMAAIGAGCCVLGALMVWQPYDWSAFVVVGGMLISFGVGPLLFVTLHEMVRLGTAQALGRTLFITCVLFVLWLPLYADYAHGGFPQWASVYHAERDAMPATDQETTGLGVALLVPIGLMSALALLVEVLRADKPGQGIEGWRMVQRLPMLRTGREAAYACIVVLLLCVFPAVVINGFLSVPIERNIAGGALRVLSVGVHQGFQVPGSAPDTLVAGDQPGHSNVQRLYNVIREADPDVVALQGSNGLTLTAGNIDIVHYLSRALAMFAYDSTHSARNVTGGVAFLTRHRLLNVTYHVDELFPRRVMARAVLPVGDYDVSLINAGPALSDSAHLVAPIEQAVQSSAVLAFLDPLLPEPNADALFEPVHQAGLLGLVNAKHKTRILHTPHFLQTNETVEMDGALTLSYTTLQLRAALGREHPRYNFSMRAARARARTTRDTTLWVAFGAFVPLALVGIIIACLNTRDDGNFTGFRKQQVNKTTTTMWK